MNIEVNNKSISVPWEYTVGMLLRQLNYSRSVAIFVNGRQLLMAEYEDYRLNENDEVKIIKPLGGG